MCMHCGKKWWGLLILVLGFLLLLRDLNIWTFWNVSPWTLIFILAGLGMASTGICRCSEMPEKKKR